VQYSVKECDMDDQVLVKKVIKGDQSAFEELVDKYKDYAFTIAYRVVKSREEAEEVAMDAFMKAYKAMKNYEGKAKFKSWLYSIVFRSAIDHLRGKKMKMTSIDEIFSFSSTNSSPYEQLGQKELNKLIYKEVDKLDATDSAIITLYYLEEKKISEVHKITGLSESNIKIRLFRARSKLKEKLFHYFEPELQ